MAASLRRRPKDPEGRMPLREHLRELRQRLIKAGIAVFLGAAAGWFLYQPLFGALAPRHGDQPVHRQAGAPPVVRRCQQRLLPHRS